MKTRKSRPLSQLKNIGKTVECRLNEIGIYSESDLEKVGPVRAYKWIKANYPDKTIPICYYLYSLQGALMGIHWDDLSAKIKKQLEAQACKPKVTKRI